MVLLKNNQFLTNHYSNLNFCMTNENIYWKILLQGFERYVLTHSIRPSSTLDMSYYMAVECTRRAYLFLTYNFDLISGFKAFLSIFFKFSRLPWKFAIFVHAKHCGISMTSYAHAQFVIYWRVCFGEDGAGEMNDFLTSILTTRYCH